jgi:hypothetical protein
MSTSKKLNPFLITIAFSLWIFIFYKYILVEDNETMLSLETVKTEYFKVDSKVLPDSVYTSSGLKDPFVTPFNKKKVVQKKTTIQKKMTVTPPPKLELIGILSDQKRYLALLKFPDNKVHFVKEGENIDKIKIIEIKENGLKYLFGRQSYQIIIQ